MEQPIGLKPTTQDMEHVFKQNPLAAEQLKTTVLSRLLRDAQVKIQELEGDIEKLQKMIGEKEA